MKKNLHSRKIKIALTLCTAAIGFIIYDFTTNNAHSYSSGAPAGVCGAPADGGTTCTGCHFDYPESSQTGWITSNVPVSGYVPGNTYTITAAITKAGHTKYGFEVSPQDASGNILGTLVNTGAETKIIGSGKYITHTSSGTSGTNSKSWSFDWTAPAQNTGSVTFYGAFLAANSDSYSSGDNVFTSTLIIPEDVSTGITAANPSATDAIIYPTIVSEQVNVNFKLTDKKQVEIKIIDLQGRLSDILLSENMTAGYHQESFGLASKYAPGIYLLSVTIGEKNTLKKIQIKLN